MKKPLLIITILFSMAHSASFDCSKASTFVAKAICSDKDASYLDESLSESYKKALETVAKPEELKAKQKLWLKKVRNRCKNVKCLKSAMENRIDELELIRHNSIMSITGKYASKDGDLEINYSEGMLSFKLLVVNEKAHIGEVEGGIELKNNSAIYINEKPEYEHDECKLTFKFAPKEVKITQEGGCGMGENVTATGTYKSKAEANTRKVIGKVGDSLGSLFYAKSEKIYKKYCHAGVEEYHGNIICKARYKTGEDSQNIVHIFSGNSKSLEYETLPPLSKAKSFIISSTR